MPPGQVTTIVGVTTATSVVFTWPSVAGANSYCIEIFTDEALTTLVKSVCGILGTSYAYNASAKLMDSDQTTCYYVIYAVNEAGSSPASPVQKLIVVSSGSISTLNTDPKIQFRIYPNPSRGVFTVIASSDAQYQIYNVHNKVQAVGKLTKGENQVNVSLSKGLYLFKVNGNVVKLIID